MIADRHTEHELSKLQKQIDRNRTQKTVVTTEVSTGGGVNFALGNKTTSLLKSGEVPLPVRVPERTTIIENEEYVYVEQEDGLIVKTPRSKLVRGASVFVQADEPVDKVVGDIWIKIS